MRPSWVRVAAVAAATASLLASCGGVPVASEPPRAATPEPSPSAARSSERPSPGESPSQPRGALASELEIGSVGKPFTDEMLQFASDGESVLFSSGLEPDAGAGAAPDLWRLTPGPSAVPAVVWRNPARDHSIVNLGGDLGLIAFVETPIDGERAWNLWLLPRGASEPTLLDTHPGDEDVPSLVPSFSVYENQIAWTAFGRGADGPVSRLLVASEPAWEPHVVAERPAAEAELWLPSLYGSQLAFTEVVYSDDRSTDERRVYVMNAGDPGSEPRRLDESGLATMPLSVDGAVLWKEADPGFNMFNWGRMFLHDLETGETRRIGITPQEYVNYPSAGSRFVAWWGADATKFGVYDLVRGHPRLVASHPSDGNVSVLRPHVAGDLLVWMEAGRTVQDATNGVLRYAFLPHAKEVDR